MTDVTGRNQCQICGLHFDPGELSIHEADCASRRDTPKGPLECAICGLECDDPDDLAIHEANCEQEWADDETAFYDTVIATFGPKPSGESR